MKLVLSLLGVAAVAAAAGGPAHVVPVASPTGGHVVVVQAVPGAKADVAVDGTVVERQAAVGTVTDPLPLSPGAHKVAFSGVPGGTITTSVQVAPKSSSDVVLHLPAAPNGAPVVNTYETPLSPIGPDKARILLAHTATVAPADAVFDGKTVFTNIANGEYADADVPAGAHRVALVPTGTTGDPILGPLAVDLAAGTATMVYAVGNPSKGSMDVVVHTLRVPGDGTSAPRSMNTGSAGLVARVEVTPFGAKGARVR